MEKSLQIPYSDDEKAEWYYLPHGENKAKGPVSKRDIDVEWRTNAIRSDTLVFKESLGGWKKLSEVAELVQLLNIANTEVTEEVLKVRDQLQSLPVVTTSTVGKFAPYQSPDGLWHYYDPETKTWRTSKEDPHKIVERKKSEDLKSPAKKPDILQNKDTPGDLSTTNQNELPLSAEEIKKRDEEKVFLHS